MVLFQSPCPPGGTFFLEGCDRFFIEFFRGIGPRRGLRLRFQFEEVLFHLLPLVLDAAEKSEPEGGLADDEILFGEQSRLALDSLDALQISMAIQQRYGVRMTDSKETRRALSSVAFLAQYLQARLT